MIRGALRYLLLLTLPSAAWTLAQQPPPAPTTAELDALLKPIPPKEPADAVKTFDAINGFRMELVAHEPDVTDPVAATFDENGLLYVAEMIDYPDPPNKDKPPLGRVRLLEDRDGDGRFESSWIFADKIRWPTGVVPYKGGVFVAAAPDIWYLKDTDGDHHADVREQVFTGFGVQNQQGTVNNLAWAFDNRIYGSASTNGGQIRTPRKDSPFVSVERRDFRFDPASQKFEAVSGREQFGNAFDDWGNRFICSESDPGSHVVLPQEYLARNPHLAVASTFQELTISPVPIFRTSPIEPWRAVRSSRRLAAGERNPASAGLSHNVIDAAAGLTIYRGDAFPEELRGDLFVGCSQNNLIHHRRIVSKGVTFQSRRVEQKAEFVRSTDIWFRPVNTFNAPDGTLYICDMSREVIEAIHIPLDVVARLNLTSGRDRGRIYRLTPPGFKVPARPQLSQRGTVELVELLAHRNGWWRDTAQRLLYERQDKSAVSPLRQLAAASKFPQARFHALWTLAGLGALEEDDLLAAMRDGCEHIREHAIRLAEPFLDRSPPLVDHVLAAADDNDPRVRFQVAFTLGYIKDPRATSALGRIARRDCSDHWMRTAILSSCADTSGDLLLQLIADKSFADDSAGRQLLNQLATLLGASQATPKIEAVAAALEHGMDSHPALSATLRRALICSLGSGMRQTGSDFQKLFPSAASTPRRLLAAEVISAQMASLDTSLPPDDRGQAIEVLQYAGFADAIHGLKQLIARDQPDAVRTAAMKSLGQFSQPEVADLLLADWRDYGPALRQEANRILFSRPAWMERVMSLMESGQISVDELGPSLRSQLLASTDAALAARARKLLGDQAGARVDVIEKYRQALALRGNPAVGSRHYERECSGCHQLGDRGNQLGPNLALTRNRTPEALLVHILDPNREVQPNYMQYIVVDDTGRTLTGIVAGETANAITLVRERGASDTILKSNIEEMASTGRSMMPEGFERALDQQAMADLIAFLLDVQYDIGTIPGEAMPGQERE